MAITKNSVQTPIVHKTQGTSRKYSTTAEKKGTSSCKGTSCKETSRKETSCKRTSRKGTSRKYLTTAGDKTICNNPTPAGNKTIHKHSVVAVNSENDKGSNERIHLDIDSDSSNLDIDVGSLRRKHHTFDEYYALLVQYINAEKKRGQSGDINLIRTDYQGKKLQDL